MKSIFGPSEILVIDYNTILEPRLKFELIAAKSAVSPTVSGGAFAVAWCYKHFFYI